MKLSDLTHQSGEWLAGDCLEHPKIANGSSKQINLVFIKF